MNPLVRRGLLFAALLLVLDQLSKWWVLDVVQLPEKQNLPVLLLGPFGLGGRDGAWAYANLGVLVALAVGFVGTLVLDRSRVRAQEA